MDEGPMHKPRQDAALGTPPHNLEAEQCVLGAILEDNEAIYNVADSLRPEHFYAKANQIVYEAMTSMANDAARIDLVLLKEYLLERGLLEKVGGEVALANLVADLYSVGNIDYYADIVREKAFLRRLSSTCMAIQAGIANPSRTSKEIRDWGEQQLFDAFRHFEHAEVAPIRDLLALTMEAIEDRHTGKHLSSGVMTGFTDLDNLTNGLHPSQLIVVAARPSMGKTSFALNVAANVAVRQRKGVLVFSLETAREQITQNILCAYARVDNQKIMRGVFDDSVWDRLVDAAGYISSAPIYVDDTPGLSLLQAKTRARLLKAREKDLSLIIIDYMQLMEGRRLRGDSREQEISQISRGLKNMSRELEVPVVALAQLNRSVERRDDHLPRLHDLRESGAIEQDADIISFLHRPAYYQKDLDDAPEAKRETHLIIAKHRNGPTKTIKLSFMYEYLRFESLSIREEDGFDL